MSIKAEQCEPKIINKIQLERGDDYEPHAKDGDLFIPSVIYDPILKSTIAFYMRIPHNVLKEALEYEPE